MKNPDFEQKIAAPFTLIPMPYRGAELAIDYAGLDAVVDGYLERGVRLLFLTAFSSEFQELSADEIRRVTKRVARRIDGRGPFVASTGYWETEESVEFSRFVSDLPLNGLLVSFPKRPVTEEYVYETWLKVADSASVPVMLQIAQIPGGNLPEFKTVLKAAEHPNIAGFKDDSNDYLYLFRLLQALDGRLAAVGGGTKLNFLFGQPYGLHTYLTCQGIVAPKQTNYFFDLVKNRRYEEARKFVLGYETPFMRTKIWANEPLIYKIMLHEAGFPVEPTSRVRNASAAPEEIMELRQVMQTLEML